MTYKLIESILTQDKPEISIIMPAIRQERWDGVYDSIKKSTMRNFELIIVGPSPLTPYLQDKKNVKYVKDYGSPMRASNIGAMLCEGKLIMWTSDDGLFIEDALDNNIDVLYSMQPYDVKNVVVTKYYEGQGYSGKDAHGDDYYKLVNAYPRTPYINPDWWIFNVAVMYREFFEELGAWDCTFQACPMGHADMAVRAQACGAKVVMSQFPMLNCDHGEGDHKPIHNAQIYEDEPLYRKIYSSPLESRTIHIDIKNWKNSDTIWKKRF